MFIVTVEGVEVRCETAQDCLKLIKASRAAEPKPEPREPITSLSAQRQKRMVNGKRREAVRFLTEIQEAGEAGIPASELYEKLDLSSGQALAPKVKNLRAFLDQLQLAEELVFLKGFNASGNSLYRQGEQIETAIKLLSDL